MVGVLNVNRGYKKVAMAGMAGLGATLGMLVLTGKLFAAFPLTGIGGFVITAPSISGDTFALTPSLSQTDQQQGWPAAMVTIASVSIQSGFELTKHFDLTATPIGQSIPSADLNILASSVTGSDLKLDSTGLQARTADFKNFDAHENYSFITQDTTENGVEGTTTIAVQNGKAIDPSKQLGLAADHIELADAAINTDALKSGTLSIGSLKLELVANTVNGSAGAFHYDSGYDNQSTKVNSQTGDYQLGEAPMHDGTYNNAGDNHTSYQPNLQPQP